MNSYLDKFLNIINPDVCLISGEVLTEVREYRYFSEEKLLVLSPPPHPLSVRDRLLMEYEADQLAISKVISLFKIKDNTNVLNPIHLFKYTGITQIGEEFGLMLSKLIDSEDYDVLIPIPIHHARRRERGFNQSDVIADSISKKIALPVVTNSIVRKKYTYSQAKLDRRDRKSNLIDKFELIDNKSIYNKRILLIDDVITTASTANYCAELLMKGGARRVDLAVIAVSY